ncbi:4-hydroxythreonine-4-phosphate dehydrogenase PdxA [Candidatus Pelagibacter sp. Uisw_114]
MYHDQVLSPMKTLFGFDAINITLGLPFITYCQIMVQIKI